MRSDLSARAGAILVDHCGAPSGGHSAGQPLLVPACRLLQLGGFSPLWRGTMTVGQSITVLTLVARFSQIAGYRCLSLMRAFLVVNCQSALVWLALRSCSQAAISSMRICLLGMRRLRHWDVRTPSSDSARLSQLPCFGV